MLLGSIDASAELLACSWRECHFFFTRIPGPFAFSGVAGMSYVKHVIQPNEKILRIGKKHWIVYGYAILFLIAGILLIFLEYKFFDSEPVIISTGALFGVLTAAYAVKGWVERLTTEIAVTDKRIIFKRGVFQLHTEETNMDKVASVDVDQTLIGRILGYGTIEIHGTGGRQAIERLYNIASPIKLRNAIDVR